MNKNVLIVALIAVNLALLTAVLFSALAPAPAYAQSGGGGSPRYAVVSMAMGGAGQGGLKGFQRDGLFVVDLQKQLLSVIVINPQADGYRLLPVAGRNLAEDLSL
jgi:hypothetical protein